MIVPLVRKSVIAGILYKSRPERGIRSRRLFLCACGVRAFSIQRYQHLRAKSSIPYAHGDFHLETIFDREQNHYLLMFVGWEGIRRVHGCLVHVDIIDDKFWIQRDDTEHGIARELMEAGVSKDREVLRQAGEEDVVVLRDGHPVVLMTPFDDDDLTWLCARARPRVS
jgi:XisI protein